VREQVDNDLPASHDIAAAQQHLKKGAIRELHWHRVVCVVISLRNAMLIVL
jgi:oxalate decarboxylase